MKQLFILALLICAGSLLRAQTTVTWTAVYQSSGPKAGVIHITANIAPGWHMYSQKPTDDGPVATSFSFPPSPLYQTDGPTGESAAHEEFDKAFGVKIASFSGKAEFDQKVKLTGAKSGSPLKFHVEFMTCNDMTCLPPKTVELSVKVP